MSIYYPLIFLFDPCDDFLPVSKCLAFTAYAFVISMYALSIVLRIFLKFSKFYSLKSDKQQLISLEFAAF